MATGSTIMIASVYIASLMTSWWGFVFWYCVMFPMGIGMVYWTPILCGWEWFLERKGLISGLILAGFGFGAFIFDFITTRIVNPENKTAEDNFYYEGVKNDIFE